jgi:hypothetical protein
VTADLAAPAEVKQILRKFRYDCSFERDEARLVRRNRSGYWLVASDVKEARSHLNFSETGKLPPGQKKTTLYEAVGEIQLGAMPLPAYLRLHPDAVVQPAGLNALKNYPNQPVTESAATASDCCTATMSQCDTREPTRHRSIPLVP